MGWLAAYAAIVSLVSLHEDPHEAYNDLSKLKQAYVGRLVVVAAAQCGSGSPTLASAKEPLVTALPACDQLQLLQQPCPKSAAAQRTGVRCT